ncbi:MAG TPA: PPOX class F420-dependent oxidoreductase [Ktedonosporobacter sp.]|nr:PPOX class F420-dependent oxidoreductase [Ktedonosporobacter sp.]
MSRFTEKELAYLKSQKTGRLATVNRHGEPQNAPVAFTYNEELDTIDIGGPNNAQSQKYRNIARNGLASFVVDDRTAMGGRGVEIRAHAAVVSEGGEAIYAEIAPAGRKASYGGFSSEVIRLTPKRIITWDLSGELPGGVIQTKRNVE